MWRGSKEARAQNGGSHGIAKRSSASGTSQQTWTQARYGENLVARQEMSVCGMPGTIAVRR
jgi:hypothetical protein